MRTMDHPNVVSLKHCFFSTTSKNELFLNLVMEYVPETIYRVLKHYSNLNQRIPLIYVKLYTYQVCVVLLSVLLFFLFCPLDINLYIIFQICRGLAYMHTVPEVCHRDLKPQNVLVCTSLAVRLRKLSIAVCWGPIDFLQVDPLSHQVKICDFGSAKMLVCEILYFCFPCVVYFFIFLIFIQLSYIFIPIIANWIFFSTLLRMEFAPSFCSLLLVQCEHYRRFICLCYVHYMTKDFSLKPKAPGVT